MFWTKVRWLFPAFNGMSPPPPLARHVVRVRLALRASLRNNLPWVHPARSHVIGIRLGVVGHVLDCLLQGMVRRRVRLVRVTKLANLVFQVLHGDPLWRETGCSLDAKPATTGNQSEGATQDAQTGAVARFRYMSAADAAIATTETTKTRTAFARSVTYCVKPASCNALPAFPTFSTAFAILLAFSPIPPRSDACCCAACCWRT